MPFPRVFLILAFLAASLGFLLASGASGASLSPLPEVSLVTDGPVHWHAQLFILDGEDELVIPADVGLEEGQPESLVHTHDESGVLHVEAESRYAVPSHSLAYFFSVWSQPLTASCVADVCTDAWRQLRFFVNGNERLDWLTYDLADGDVVEFVLEPVTAGTIQF